VFRSTATEDFKYRAQAAREALESANKEKLEANQLYARALYEAGAPSAVDPAISARNAEAEQRVVEARDIIADLVEEGRADGVDKNLIDMWEEMNLGQ
jgi:K+-transporting ATPase c subunit